MNDVEKHPCLSFRSNLDLTFGPRGGTIMGFQPELRCMWAMIQTLSKPSRDRSVSAPSKSRRRKILPSPSGLAKGSAKRGFATACRGVPYLSLYGDDTYPIGSREMDSGEEGGAEAAAGGGGGGGKEGEEGGIVAAGAFIDAPVPPPPPPSSSSSSSSLGPPSLRLTLNALV